MVWKSKRLHLRRRLAGKTWPEQTLVEGGDQTGFNNEADVIEIFAADYDPICI
jgi:hypothetical protein